MIDAGPPQAPRRPSDGGTGRSRRWVVGLGIGAILVAVAAIAVTCWLRPRDAIPVADTANQADDWDEPPVPNPGYLGVEACAPCHARRVAEFRLTRHFQACLRPQDMTMPTGFRAGKNIFATRTPALRFEMTHQDDGYFQTPVLTTSKGTQRTAAPIALVYGGGGVLDEVYFTWHDDHLRELPVAWLHPQQRWGISSYNPYGPGGDYARETTPRCLECHNTWFAHTPGTRNEYRRDAFVLGVTCEKCHGPGREHAAFHEAHADAVAAHAIVQPGHLPRERLLEVCTQCHSNAIHARGPAFGYRPGTPLDDYFKTIVTKYPENDHVANQSTYLRQSRCFQKSDTLTCITCHDPHRPHDAAKPGAGSRACLQCHQPAGCGEQPHLPVAVRGDCVGCHMPARIWMNVHFHTEDDQYVPPIRRTQHRIAIDPLARQEVLLRWYRAQADAPSRAEAARLAKSLSNAWVGQAEDRQRDHRFLAAIGALREAKHWRPSDATEAKLRQAVALQARIDAELARGLHAMDERRFTEAITVFKNLLTIKPDFAIAHGKLGTAYAVTGQRELAIEQLNAVAQCDPNDPSGFMMLGWLAYLKGNAQDACAAYQRADAVEPFNVKTHYHWALALAKLDQLAEASKHFRLALKIDPRHAGASQGLSHVLRRQGDATEAVRYARHAAHLTQEQNADVLVSLADAYADAGRYAEAVATAGKALDAAQVRSPDLVPAIRWRLEDLRTMAKRAAK